MNRLIPYQVVLKAIMLRRLKNSRLNGQALLELPPRQVEIVQCQFDEEEAEFYKALTEMVDTTLNKYIKSGNVMRNYTSVMVLLLRLRQGIYSICLFCLDMY